MIQPIFYINGDEVDPPSNWPELSLSLDFNNIDTPESVVKNNTWNFISKNAQLINKWITDGFNFEGLDFRIDLTDGVTTETVMLGQLDPRKANPISCDSITLPAIENKIDWLNENGNFTMEFLREKKLFAHPRFNFVPIPYVVSSIPNYPELAIAFVASVSLIFTIEAVVEELIDKITNCGSFEWGEWIASIIFFAYVVFVMLASIQTLLMLFNLLIQPVKFHLGMRVTDMLVVGFAYLGYDFKSTVFESEEWEKVAILPEKFQNSTDDNPEFSLVFDSLGIDLNVLKGFSKESDAIENGTAYYSGTFKQLVADMKLMINGKIVFEEPDSVGATPIVRLERKDYNQTLSSYTLPDESNNKLSPEHTLNADEFKSSYFVTFLTDTSDKNTIDEFKGTSFTEIIEPITVNNKRNLLLSGREEVRIPFALGKRKEDLTSVEEVLDKLFTTVEPLANEFVFQHNVKLKQAGTIVNTIIDSINTVLTFAGIQNLNLPQPNTFLDLPYIQIPDLSELIGDRIGMLKLEDDFVNVPKIIMIEKNFNLENESTLDPAYLAAPYVFEFFDQNNLEALQGVIPVGVSAKSNVVSAENADFLSAENIWKKYHSINSFVPNIEGVTNWGQGKHNQYIRKQINSLYLCYEDYRTIRGNNQITTTDGKTGRIEQLDWNVDRLEQEVKYRINEIYNENLKSTQIVHNGATKL